MFQFCLHLVFAEFELLASATECEEDKDLPKEKREVNKGKQQSVVHCANACHVISPIFIYGVKGTSACQDGHCSCYCERHVDDDGKCMQTRTNKKYDLFRYVKKKEENKQKGIECTLLEKKARKRPKHNRCYHSLP